MFIHDEHNFCVHIGCSRFRVTRYGRCCWPIIALLSALLVALITGYLYLKVDHEIPKDDNKNSIEQITIGQKLHIEQELEKFPQGHRQDITLTATANELTTDVETLPFPIEHFVGRENEMSTLLKLLDSDTVIIAITGAPGMGKSTLAIHVGQEMDKKGHKVQYVDMNRFYSASSVSDEFKSLSTDLERWVRKERSKTLLILDNCDEVLHTNKEDF